MIIITRNYYDFIVKTCIIDQKMKSLCDPHFSSRQKAIIMLTPSSVGFKMLNEQPNNIES